MKASSWCFSTTLAPERQLSYSAEVLALKSSNEVVMHKIKLIHNALHATCQHEVMFSY
jgi:hypothetical protein